MKDENIFFSKNTPQDPSPDKQPDPPEPPLGDPPPSERPTPPQNPPVKQPEYV